MNRHNKDTYDTDIKKSQNFSLKIELNTKILCQNVSKISATPEKQHFPEYLM